MDGDFEVDPADSYCLQLFCRQSTQLDSTTLSQQRLPLDQTRRSCDLPLHNLTSAFCETFYALRLMINGCPRLRTSLRFRGLVGGHF